MGSGLADDRSWRRWSLWPVPITASLAVIAIPLLWGGDPMRGYLVAAALIIISAGTAIWAVRRSVTDRHRYEAVRVARERIDAARTERRRLAAELHDVVSNGIGMMTVRAAAARRIDDHADHREALADIEQLGRRSTAEMRRMLTLLDPPTGTEDGASPLTFDALPQLIADATAAGLRVDIERSTLPSLPVGLELVCCSVIREGLANAARHAGPTTVTIDVSASREGVTTRIVDAGPRSMDDRQPGAGCGLARLEERLDAVGGTLTYGRCGDGFQLTATTPTDAT